MQWSLERLVHSETRPILSVRLSALCEAFHKAERCRKANVLSPATHPLRTARLHPRGFHENRVLHHLLAKIEELII
jgi:hypothetical protein